MREVLFLGVAITAFALAALLPTGDESGSAGTFSASSTRVLHVPAPKRRTQVDSDSQWNAGETVLERSGDGHFYAQVSVNGIPVEALVDTGASMVALTGADAQAMGLNWDDSELREIGSGASGPVFGIPVTLDRVELGGHQATNVDAVIIPEGLGITLLGQSFLTTVNPVRIEGSRMVLGG